MQDREQKHITKFIRKVCKGLTKEEYKQAELNYLRFIQLAERVNNRLILERERENQT